MKVENTEQSTIHEARKTKQMLLKKKEINDK